MQLDTKMTDLITAKHNAQVLVNSTAETTRALFVGPISTYLQFLEETEEAADYAAAGYPADATSFPHVAIEAIILAQTPTVVADRILAKKSAWITNSAKIKGIYLGVVRDLGTATTTEQVAIISSSAVIALNAIHP